MTDMVIPDGRAPRKLTVKDKMDARDKEVAEAHMRGVLPDPPVAPVFPWVQYTRGVSGALSLQWQAVGGYSKFSGNTFSGLSFNGNGGWTLSAGIWAIKAGLRISSSTSAQIFCLSSTNSGDPTPYPGGEASFPNIDVGAWGSLAIDVNVSSSASVYPYVYITNSTPTVIDGVISFWKIA